MNSPLKSSHKINIIIFFGLHFIFCESYAQACYSECMTLARINNVEPFTRVYNAALAEASRGWVMGGNNNEIDNIYCREIITQDSKVPLSELEEFVTNIKKYNDEAARYDESEDSGRKGRYAYLKYKQCMISTRTGTQPKNVDDTTLKDRKSIRANGPNSVPEAAIKRAIHCLVPGKSGNPKYFLGYIKSVCAEAINYAYCLEPTEGVFSSMKCGEKFIFGGLRPGEIDGAADTRGVPHWFACPAPSAPKNVTFFEGRGIRASCE